MFDNLLIISGPTKDLEEEVKTRQNPFSFAKAMTPPPASNLPRKKRQRWIRKEGLLSWQEAVHSGQEKPGILAEWKQVNWGGLPRGRAERLLESGRLAYRFRSDGFPGPLVRALEKKYPECAFVLASLSGEKFQDARIQTKDVVSPDCNLVHFAALAEKEGLIDFFDCRLRATGELLGSRDKLTSGRLVHLRLFNQKLRLQQENFIQPLRGDVLLEEGAPLRDVLLAQSSELRFWLDLF